MLNQRRTEIQNGWVTPEMLADPISKAAMSGRVVNAALRAEFRRRAYNFTPPEDEEPDWDDAWD